MTKSSHYFAHSFISSSISYHINTHNSNTFSQLQFKVSKFQTHFIYSHSNSLNKKKTFFLKPSFLIMMRNKGQSQNMFIRIMSSPIRALGKARDAYVRSITNCGQSYGGSYPMDAASKFSSLSRSQSAATSRRSTSSSRRSTSSPLEGNEDFAELVRAASARTLVTRLDMDLVLKQQQQQQQKLNKGLPKSSSVSMAKIDEDMPFDSSVEGKIGFVADSYPRSKSYAVGHNRHRNVAF
ncbi:unnamed protein product [Trifolium pratense]|uniref:Uncharacterized protein n=1 Tax=Trifolium pratense TaxID=57577 RepID=A0ACB0M1X6_TRIPR|nr:unnamed protein product [Trifolium pratense]